MAKTTKAAAKTAAAKNTAAKDPSQTSVGGVKMPSLTKKYLREALEISFPAFTAPRIRKQPRIRSIAHCF